MLFCALLAAVSLLAGCENDTGRPVPGFCEDFSFQLRGGGSFRGDLVALPGTRFAAVLGYPTSASLTAIDLADRRIDTTLAVPEAASLKLGARPTGASRLFIVYTTPPPARNGLAEAELETPSIIRRRDYPGALNTDTVRGAAYDPSRQKIYLSVNAANQLYHGLLAVDAHTLDLLDLDLATAVDRIALSNAHYTGSFQAPGDIAFDRIGDVIIVTNGGSQAVTFVAAGLLVSPHDPGAPQPALPRIDVGGTPYAVDVDQELRVAVVSVQGTGIPIVHRVVVIDLITRTIRDDWDITHWGTPEPGEISVVPGTGWVAVAAGVEDAGVRLIDWRTGNLVVNQTGIEGRAWVDVAPAYNLGIGVNRSHDLFVGYCLER